LLIMPISVIKVMKLQWDNDLLLENIWPSILKISPWQYQIARFFSTLHLLNKAWK
jgi:hypothetical protein